MPMCDDWLIRDREDGFISEEGGRVAHFGERDSWRARYTHAYVHALGVNVLIGGNREWGMMVRLPQSRSEWCILWRADKSVLSQTESHRVPRLIQNVRRHLRNNVAFKLRGVRIRLMKLCLYTGYTRWIYPVYFFYRTIQIYVSTNFMKDQCMQLGRNKRKDPRYRSFSSFNSHESIEFLIYMIFFFLLL